jgi:hypothetical protein
MSSGIFAAKALPGATTKATNDADTMLAAKVRLSLDMVPPFTSCFAQRTGQTAFI